MSKDIILTPDDVAEIIAIIDGTSYEHIDISTRRFSLRLARSGEGWTQDWTWDRGDAAPVAVAPTAVGDEVEAEATDGSIAVRPPLPGVFYCAPQPGAEPFVKAGDIVTSETVIGIIETMKLMNPVHAGVAGVVQAILIDNGVQVDPDTIILRVVPEVR
ncbi:acetyl-CoA carboxylase biotin carboxyl carrier protein [Sphingobium sp. YR768]|uniref:acetyl-CoA carboxylase biotin carboxyl carrier protein n=1 Tax=Sphingobium sp. YR768 TaxID=1884365 RepID=UPI0008B89F87|nr:biotin/lipoyl-containing protein [Sphingobium sp. YR768]SER26917.1 acetyl-CoA carboxylase biotin carboxyl carrier protein [Sphingobium sp. YR768]